MTVGILGGGQLGRMLALAGYPLGERSVLLDPSDSACAGHVAPLIIADWADERALCDLADRSDVVTFEFENVPGKSLSYLQNHARVAPPARALEVAQDRLHEKQLFERLGIQTGPFAPASSRDELLEAVQKIGLPAVIKTRRFGYDGKGQALVRNDRDVQNAWDKLGSLPLIVEAFVPFAFELSAIVARNWQGDVARYPLIENIHRAGILRESRPASPKITEELTEQAARATDRLLKELDYVGVLTIEFFVTEQGLLANECAPRVHNSGHYSIEGALTSQFENHMRAVLGAPLGDTSCHVRSAMLNCIGQMPDRDELAAIPGVCIHDYAKSPKPGRKVGHVTVLAENIEELQDRLSRARAIVENATDT
ncbi:MAG TPA: 5-(carboxyamino)imidazole ribonucleotide synthase [Myxococcales bacterium]|nr:5-(carboxyamino)imidazole ribonucleotide synthase [Myxococcales bacterium]HAN32344.1 5-(carboxyamino)imidazole ribonucleotide synthase [Myxococcales bacterium]